MTVREQNRSMGWITDAVCGIANSPAPLWWTISFAVFGSLAVVGLFCMTYLVSTGVGVWGNNSPVFWAWDITNFVFWIGIGHAGTLISAIFFLLRQKWRTSVHRLAEAMTLFAVICAAIYPMIHIGRPWLVWFLAPVPNSNGIWQNFQSPLLWDTFAVGTYFTVSLLFCYTGLIPDLATMRDHCTGALRKRIYGILALGWRGGSRQWRHYEAAYLILAGLSTPLVLSVHSVVSADFAATMIPGWHATIFPPYFVAGAIFGGCAMLLTIMLPLRMVCEPLRELVTVSHVDRICKIILMTGSMVAYAYLIEFFMAWYGGNPYERSAFWQRAFGPYWLATWSMIFCNAIVPQLFWFRRFRTNLLWVWVLVLFPDVGMWLERFVIIAATLSRDFLPSSWALFHPTWVDVWTFIGTTGIFVSLILLFIRFLPVAGMFELKAALPEVEVRKS